MLTTELITFASHSQTLYLIIPCSGSVGNGLATRNVQKFMHPLKESVPRILILMASIPCFTRGCPLQKVDIIVW